MPWLAGWLAGCPASSPAPFLHSCCITLLDITLLNTPQVPVIPITLVGTGDLMPNAKEYLLYPGKVTVSEPGCLADFSA